MAWMVGLPGGSIKVTSHIPFMFKPRNVVCPSTEKINLLPFLHVEILHLYVSELCKSIW